MGASDAMQKAMLDWVLGGAAATRPGSRFVSFATQSPTSRSAFDGPFTPRRTVTFAAANSPQMSVTNAAVISATATAVATIVGFNIWDRAAAANATRLFWGTMTASVGCLSGDTIGIPTGALKVVLT
jgi:hypothetical protein